MTLFACNTLGIIKRGGMPHEQRVSGNPDCAQICAQTNSIYWWGYCAVRIGDGVFADYNSRRSSRRVNLRIFQASHTSEGSAKGSPQFGNLSVYMLTSGKMTSPGPQKQDKNLLPLNQRRRPRPSRVKALPPYSTTPAERLRMAFELSDFCLALRESARR